MLHADVLAAQALLQGARPAVVDAHSGTVRTYAELDRRANALVRVLRGRGVGPGAVVGWVAFNRIEMIEALFACVRLGAALAADNPRATAWEMSRKLGLTAPACVVVERDILSVLGRVPGVLRTDWSDRLVLDTDGLDGYERAIAGVSSSLDASSDASPDATAAILFTSGSTATPRGVRLPQRMLAGNALVTATSWQLGRDTTVAIVSPMWHAGGFGALLLPTLTAGGRLVLLRQFSAPTFWATMRRHEVQLAFGVPTLWQRASAAPGFADARIGGVRWLLCGGAPMPLPLHLRYRSAGLLLRQGYGMTEAGINLCTSDDTECREYPGSVGRALPWVEISVCRNDGQPVVEGEVGELLIGGPFVADGYVNAPPETTATFGTDGRVRTGDLVRRDEVGRLWLQGRAKDVFVSSGFTVSPAEVELALHECADLAEVAVVALPDPDRGEIGVAFVVPAQPPLVAPERLREAVRERLSGYKVPARIVTVPTLPRTSSGKVDRRALIDSMAPRLDG
ncbi:MAG: class I adenylate-forming enzyme family protein [Luteitalea sp.]